MRKTDKLLYRAKEKWKNYKLRHLSIGKVKWLDKNNPFDFKIVNIDWEITWATNIYLTVIIRDYLRFFIKNNMVIGHCVMKNKNLQNDEIDDNDREKWERLVTSVADEFDELLRLDMEIEKAEEISDLRERKGVLMKKAFSDLAFIYDDLWW